MVWVVSVLGSELSEPTLFQFLKPAHPTALLYGPVTVHVVPPYTKFGGRLQPPQRLRPRMMRWGAGGMMTPSSNSRWGGPYFT